jgi:ubiquinone/menaquinone biosynthesis C-methylase UbiE
MKQTSPRGIESYYEKTASYSLGRPSYSRDAIDFVVDRLQLLSSMHVADIGAGTGILTRALENRFRYVTPVEPNDEMRLALGQIAIKGTAEETNLPNESVDAIFAAQAFHWFNPALARKEFRRVLKESKPVILLWNDRQAPAESGAEQLDIIMKSLRSDYSPCLEANDEAIAQFYERQNVEKREFDNPFQLSKIALVAMVMSRSYAPRKGDAQFGDLLKTLEDLFDHYSSDGLFSLPYKTQVYWGWL